MNHKIRKRIANRKNSNGLNFARESFCERTKQITLKVGWLIGWVCFFCAEHIMAGLGLEYCVNIGGVCWFCDQAYHYFFVQHLRKLKWCVCVSYWPKRNALLWAQKCWFARFFHRKILFMSQSVADVCDLEKKNSEIQFFLPSFTFMFLLG